MNTVPYNTFKNDRPARVSGYVLPALLILSLLLLLSLVQYQPDLPPSAFGYRLFRVVGSSMEPTFGNGSVLIVRNVASTEIQPGDIITYHCSRSQVALTTHRVKSIDTSQPGCIQYVTRGDGNPVVDPLRVQDCHVVGRVEWVVTPPARIFAGLSVQAFALTLQLTLGVMILLFFRLLKHQKENHDDYRIYQ